MGCFPEGSWAGRRARAARVICLALVLQLKVTSAQSPSINYLVPYAVEPGKTTTVTFFGEHLNGASELWTTFPSRVTPAPAKATNQVNGKKVAFQIALPKNVPVGIGAVQLATTNGVSEMQLVMIDDLPGIGENETNQTVAAAQDLKLPVAVEGHCEELGSDFYRFSAKKGQRMSVEVVANRLGSPLDPVIRLLDASGREWAYCDDDPAAGSDSRVRFTAPASGRYVIELRDVAYQGGPKFRYRLRVGNFPLTSAPFPAGAQQGTETQVTFVGPATEGVRPLNLRVSETATRVTLNPRFSGGRGSGFVTFAAGHLPEVMELEPNDWPETATRISVPCVVNGRFAWPKDRDWFEITADKGERLVILGKSRSLGSPCDLFMRLFNFEGKPVAEADISGANEGTITNRFNEAGAYHLLVEELNRGGQCDFVYRIGIERLQPGFTLSVETNRVQAAPESSFELKVSAARNEYDGPITLSLACPRDDFDLENNVIAEKKNETTLKAKLPARVEPGQLIHFTIVGKANVGGAPFEATASTLPALKKAWPLLRYPPAELDGLIGLGIRVADHPEGQTKWVSHIQETAP